MRNAYSAAGRRWGLLVVWAMALSITVRAQAPMIQWQRVLPGAGEEGSFFTPPYFTDAPDGGLGVISANHDLVKLSSAGELLWSVPILGRNAESGQKLQRPTGIAPTQDGGFVVLADDRTGWFIAEYNVNGDRAWIKKVVDYNAANNSYEDELIQTADGGFLVLGSRRTQRPNFSTFATKFDADGNLSWEKEIYYTSPSGQVDSNTGATRALSLPDGGYLLVGYSSGDSFGSWVARLNRQGTIIWQNKYGSPTVLEDVIVNPAGDGSYIAVGTTSGSNNRTDVYRITPDGGYTNIVAIPNSSPVSGFKVSIAPGTAYEEGPSFTVADNTQQNGNSSIRLTHVGPGNQVRWTKLLGGSSDSQGILTKNDGYVVVGVTYSNGGDLAGYSGQFGTWVVKLGQPAPPANPITLMQPTYDCQTGAITFNTTGGDGTTITYTAPGISRANTTDNVGTVEPGLRADPKVITITATQSGYSTTYRFDLAAYCANPQPPVVNPPPSGDVLTLLAPTYDCRTGTITFNTSGGDGTTVTYTAPGVSRSSLTSNTGTVESELRADPSPIPIRATQSGVTVTYVFDLPGACGSRARQAAPTERSDALRVIVRGNPVDAELMVDVSGATGQALRLELVDGRGRLVSQRRVDQAAVTERHTFDVRQQASGVLLLRVLTTNQTKTVKVLKP